MGIVSVDVGLVSVDDRLVDFYVTAMPATRLEPRVFDFATIHRMACGPITLKVFVPTARPAAPPTAGHFGDIGGLRYLTFWVDDLDALTERWTAAGGTVAEPPRDLRPGVRFALLADPDGNWVEALEQS
jgi:catechol 2,3-dioxygenase-like lactoylglutathione lyase family enzyme